jgi:hypothetical protein
VGGTRPQPKGCRPLSFASPPGDNTSKASAGCGTKHGRVEWAQQDSNLHYRHCVPHSAVALLHVISRSGQLFGTFRHILP